MDLTINNMFSEIETKDTMLINGGGILKKIGAGLCIVGGVGAIIVGCALIGTPEPTAVTKIAGASLVITGGAAIVTGICALC